jgi:hypothetical protein
VVHRHLNVRARGPDVLECLGRESHFLEGAAWSSCPHTDIEDASVRLLPTQPSFTPETADVLKEFLRGRFSIQDDTAWIENQPTRIGPAFRDQGLVRPGPRGDEGSKRSA